MTEAIRQSASRYACSEDTIVCKPTREAPPFIETYEDQVKAAPGMIELVRENEQEFDAFIVACHCDPNLNVLKEITIKPVIGIGEASMKIASMLGHKYSIVSATNHCIPMKEELVRAYCQEGNCASVRGPENYNSKCSEEEKYYSVARKAIEEDMAEVIILGCAGIGELDKKLESTLRVPVLDPVVCALIIAEGLVRYNVSTSKQRRYNAKDH